MAIPFASEEWAQALSEALNASAAYKDAAKKWEGDLCMVIPAGSGMAQDTYLYLDLWHGDCRNAYATNKAVEAEFLITAPYPTWKEVTLGKLDPIKGILSRKLKLNGPLAKILKSPNAAVELVNCAKSLDTAWPV